MGGALGTIGDYTIPYVEVSEAIGTALTIVNRYAGTISVDSLASELKLEKTGGGFRMKVTSLKGYGLVEGRGKLQSTDLANKIALTKDEIVANRHKGFAFLNYPLFKQIFNRFGDKVPDEEAFTNTLQDITKVNRIEVSKVVPRILRYFADASPYLKGIPRSDSEQTQISKEASGKGQGETTVSQLMVHTPQKALGGLDEIIMGDVRIYLKPELEDVATAKGLLAVYEKKLKKKLAE